MRTTQRVARLGLLATLLCASSTAIAQNYDLVINGGRVMDPETNYDAVANVGIKDGRIAVITKSTITGQRAIDAKGLVVAPGFIDTHLHAQDLFGSKLALRDGTTTGMDLELGAFDVAAWYEQKVRAGGWPLNYGTSDLGAHALPHAESDAGGGDSRPGRDAGQRDAAEPVEVHSRRGQITVPIGSFGDDTAFGHSALNPKR